MKKIVGTSLNKPARCGTLRIEAVRREPERSRAVPPRPGTADPVCNKAEKPFAARSGFVGCAADVTHHAPARPTLFATRRKSPLQPEAALCHVCNANLLRTRGDEAIAKPIMALDGPMMGIASLAPSYDLRIGS
jgi:hypothetical protein